MESLKNNEVKKEEIMEASMSETKDYQEETPLEILSEIKLIPKEKEPIASTIVEIPEMREENKKVYTMSDGSDQVIIYPDSVHAKRNDSDSYEDLFTNVYDEDNYRVISSGEIIVKLNKDSTSKEVLSVSKGDCSIAFAAENDIRKNEKGESEGIFAKRLVDDALILENSDDNNIKLEYAPIRNGVKEKIVIINKRIDNHFGFDISCNNLKISPDSSDRRIAFVSVESGEEVFCIPAPFMEDGAGNVSTDVAYNYKEENDGNISFEIVADNDWINATDRVFPVIIDPQIISSGTNSITTYSWRDGTIFYEPVHTVGITDSLHINRMYISLNVPTLPRNPRIKKVELCLHQFLGINNCDQYSKIGVYHVTGAITPGTCTPGYDNDLIDYEKIVVSSTSNLYSFDITRLFDIAVKNNLNTVDLVVKLLDESVCENNYAYFSGVSGAISPNIKITYESNYGITNNSRNIVHSIGTVGQGIVDLECGNLMLELIDFTWAGRRMPVTIKHYYNSALSDVQYTNNDTIKLKTADFSGFKIGNGFKLNCMQSIRSASFVENGILYEGYVFTTENGSEVYFKESEEAISCESDSQCYYLFKSLSDNAMVYDPIKRTLIDGDLVLSFDSYGRLVIITDKYGNEEKIEYSQGLFDCIIDGANREFYGDYDSSNHVIKLVAPDESEISFEYDGDYLTNITYPDGKSIEICYWGNKPSSIILSNNSENVLKYEYEFSNDRLVSITEFGVSDGIFVEGKTTTFDYSISSHRTVVSVFNTEDVNSESNYVYTFDDDGNILSKYGYYEDLGNVGIVGEGNNNINPHLNDSEKGVVSNINNLLSDHNFESLDAWHSMPGNHNSFDITMYAYERDTLFGKKCIRIQSVQEEEIENGIFQTSNVLSQGEYTFSMYFRVKQSFTGSTDPGVFIRVTTLDGYVLAESEHIVNTSAEYIRLVTPFSIATPQSVKTCVLMNGKGIIYGDAAQLENNVYCNSYNMLSNGNFENGVTSWASSSGVSNSGECCFNMSHSLKMVGNLDNKRFAYQIVTVKTNRATRESFTLSGWAKGYGIVNRSRNNSPDALFRLRAVIKYYDSLANEYGTEEYCADFSSSTDEWQLASVKFAKAKYCSIEKIYVYCDYDYNCGIAFFDDIQLIRDSLETDLSASDFAIDLDCGNQSVEFDVSESETVYEEAKDLYGNMLTETTFGEGELGTLYRSFEYNTDDSSLEMDDAGNNMISETDPCGNSIIYSVDSITSRNDEIVARSGNKLAFEYDEIGRVSRTISKREDDSEISEVSYLYDGLDNTTSIIRGDGMKYSIEYNPFHHLQSIRVDGEPNNLVDYEYNNGNGKLKSITYANGDVMRVTYNSLGYLVSEKWFDSFNSLTGHYKYVYDGSGNIVRSIDLVANKEIDYEYRDDLLIRRTEFNVVINESEAVISKTVSNTIIFVYDNNGRIIKKCFIPFNGEEQTTYFEYPENENVQVKYNLDGVTILSRSRVDIFGRKDFDELQIGSGCISRKFSYHRGVVSDTHKAYEKVKSTPTSKMVRQIEFSDGRVLSYDFDEEERIVCVFDSEEGITEYSYDEQGQLLTEKVNDVIVNSMIYDEYGNIRSKNGVPYSYDNASWKDLLTCVADDQISYDAQGNPTNYMNHILVWEKGRQLKSFDDVVYTYNGNGIRTSKSIDNEVHSYILDGTKIVRETWDDNTLIPIYDHDGNVCGIVFNEDPYYFQKNLQGDVIGIIDRNAVLVAKYSYDAWGECSITEDISECEIADINPFRYRGYYYDVESGFYYLVSRYYDPVIGRFISSDEPLVICLNDEVNALNAWKYCNNNPICNTDPLGYFAIADDVIVAGIAVTAIVAIALLSMVSSSKFQSAWKDFCNGLAGLLGRIWGWITSWFLSSARIVQNAIEKNVDKTIDTIKRKRYTEYYWIASSISFKKKSVKMDSYFPCMPISFKDAKIYVKKGGDVFASSQSSARKLAYAVGNGAVPEGPEIHGGLGYFWHYHAHRYLSRGHMFFVFWG